MNGVFCRLLIFNGLNHLGLLFGHHSGVGRTAPKKRGGRRIGDRGGHQDGDEAPVLVASTWRYFDLMPQPMAFVTEGSGALPASMASMASAT